MSESKKPRPINLAFYTGSGVNWYPDKAMMATPQAFEALVLQGWKPKEPFITLETRIATFGSCFAERIASFLKKNGYRSNKSSATEDDDFVFMSNWGGGLNNTFILEQQFRYAFTDWVPAPTQWLDRQGNPVDGARWKGDLTAFFHETDVFILTLGLAEIWRDTVTGEAMWGTTLQGDYLAGRHVFGVTSVEDNYRNLTRIVQMVREHRPGAKIIFTLSPVPLTATFRPVSCMTANEVSKSILRVAVDMLMRDEHPDVYYYPSYELVRNIVKDPYIDDAIHVGGVFLSKLMKTFLNIYGVGVRREVTPPAFLGCADTQITQQFAEKLAAETGRKAVALLDPDFNVTCEQIDKTPLDPTLFYGPYLQLYSTRLWQTFLDSPMIWVLDETSTPDAPDAWKKARPFSVLRPVERDIPYMESVTRSVTKTQMRNQDRTLVLKTANLARARDFLNSGLIK